MYIGYKYRLYPTPEQAEQINRTIGCARYVYNDFRTQRGELWRNRQKNTTLKQQSAELSQLKHDKDHLWLREVDSTALQAYHYKTYKPPTTTSSGI